MALETDADKKRRALLETAISHAYGTQKVSEKAYGDDTEGLTTQGKVNVALSQGLFKQIGQMAQRAGTPGSIADRKSKRDKAKMQREMNRIALSPDSGWGEQEGPPMVKPQYRDPPPKGG